MRRPALLLFLATCSSSSAFAAYPDNAFYLGLHGGGQVGLTPWDLGKNAREDGLQPEGSFGGMGGLRLGYDLSPRLAAEFGGTLLAVSSTAEAGNTALEYDLTALYHLSDKDWTPIVLGGVGGYHLLSGDLGADFDPQLHLGVGLRGLVLPWLALRLEARDVVSDGFSAAGGNNLDLRGGVDVFFGTKAPDKDGDGISDDQDACPDVAGQASAAGCPDKDGDGIADAKDACPAHPGKDEFEGCADSDGDGIANPQDTCPDVPGLKALGGCPDKDGDGITDADDACPEVAGTKALKGCPDGDGDGIADGVDACPNVAGHASAKGCPDRDGDSVVDKDDKCPDLRGLPAYQGCVPAAVAKFTGAIKGINFQTNSAEILPASFGTLDKAVDVMKKFPELRLDIEGHTDDVGEDAFNQKLSEERAASVKAYLVGKGIDASRLETHGYGETRPVVPNKNEKNRAQNRRIEFKLLGQAG